MAIKLKVKHPELAEEQVPAGSFKKRIDAITRLDAQARALQLEVEEVARDQLDKLRRLLPRIEEQKKQLLEEIVALHEEDDPDQEFFEDGTLMRVKVSKKVNERKIADMKALYALLEKQQKGLFLQLASVKLGDIDKYLTQAERDEVLERSRGKRTATLETRPVERKSTLELVR